MRYLQTFFYSLIKTFSSLDYYTDILKAPLSFSLKFFYFYFFLYALLQSTVFSIKYLPRLSKTLQLLPTRLSQIYPQELEIIIQNGQISTNVAEPYLLPLERIKQIFSDEEKTVLGSQTQVMENFLAIDTQAKIEDFPKYRTFFLLTKDSLVILEKNGWQVMPLKKIEYLVINRDLVQKIFDNLLPYLKFLAPVLILFIFIFVFWFMSLSTLFYVFFLALIILLMAKILKIGLSYSKSFQLGLHLVIIPTTIFGFLEVFDLQPQLPWLRTLFLIGLSLLVLKRIKK